MRLVFLACLVFPILSSCGVNPERAKNLRIKEEQSVTRKSLQKSDEDPAEVSKAIDDLGAFSLAIDGHDWTALSTLRNAVLKPIKLEANARVATHQKTPLILEELERLDRRLAEKMGNLGASLLDVSREREISSDALFSMEKGIQACETLAGMQTKTALEQLAEEITNAFSKSASLDPRVFRYSGKDQSGGVIDVPFEKSLCEFRIQNAKVEIEDAEPAFADLSSTYVGCGQLDLQVMSKQDEKGGFGPYFLTTKSAFSESAGPLKRVECGAIPPLSDAPKDIISLVKSNVQWLKANDILSLKGDFKYEEGEGGMRKLGKVVIYRRDSNLKTTACGAKDAIIACSQIGNKVALAYDLAAHYSERAKIHRANSNVERCKLMAQKALEMSSQKIDYDGKLIYQTNKNTRFQPSEIKAKIEAMKTEASAMSSSSWCDRNSNTN